MSAAIYPTDPIYAGDTWAGIPEISIRPNGEIPSDPVATAKLIFFKAEDGPLAPALTLDSPVPMAPLPEEGPQIEITNGAQWAMNVPPQILDLGPGEWTFRFSTTAADDDATVRTWIVGVLSIL